MYDKVKLWVDRAEMGESLNLLPQYLDEANQNINLSTGETSVHGSINGMMVHLYGGGMSITGSLPKYLYGNNIVPMGIKSTREAIESLQDALHFDLSQANITQIEFGANIVLRHRVPEYLKRMGDKPHLKRQQYTDSTLYYRHNGKEQPKTFCFYDKQAEARKAKMDVPKGFEGVNLLRYEMRYNGRLPHQLKVPEVTASTLYDEAFYCKMSDLWQDHYFSIKKQQQLRNGYMEQIKSPKEAVAVFMATLIQQSQTDLIAEYLEQLKSNHVFADRKNYTRVKAMLLQIAGKAKFSTTDELIKELDAEVKSIASNL